MKPGRKRKPPIGSPAAIAEYNRWRARCDRDLLRGITAWARAWERCPESGCRRNGRCLYPDDACRSVPKELTAEHRRLIREATAGIRARLSGNSPAPTNAEDE